MNRFAFLLVLIPLTMSSGCVMVDDLKEMNRQTMRAIRPRATDYRDYDEVLDDDWSFVGEEARGDMAREKDPDQWWRKYIMSPQARSIERNLGFD